jgi:TRAP-type C4-dicarboxylate transport system substrate-binding protein
MRIFLAGIMQGSHVAALVHDQTYRERFREAVERRWPEAEVYDPHANHANSIGYGADQARNVFTHHVAMCTQFDLIVAYVPEASMGTAIEMWEAYRHGRVVVTITPLIHNWVVQITSRAVYRDFDGFLQGLESGEIDALFRA